MAIDAEYAAIGIDLRAARRDADADRLADNPVERKFGRAILQLRLYWGFSQAELGRRAGVSQSTISRLEAGIAMGLSLRRMFAILRALRLGELRFLPRPPAVEMTDLELMVQGDPWLRAKAAAERRLNRRRSA
ncbi:MAG TPA: helix-turn-helix transcriptional regulator [Candidatus Limnocylindrales bacterium]|nr:helix-turn-helix transcriptional regulator [Candidatus Limnocylindrales bacterium]